MGKRAIKFKRSYQVQAAGGPSYEKNEVVELDEASAEHFVVRRVAEDTKEKPGKPKAKAEGGKKGKSQAEGGQDNAG